METISQFDLFRQKADAAQSRRRSRHLEDKLQVSCRCWFDLQYPKLRLLLHHSPNEGLLPRRASDGAKRKAMGVRAGFPDLILLLPNHSHPFLAIELKTAEGRQSQTQKDYQSAVEEAGGEYVIVRSLEQFKSVIDGYVANV